MSQISSTKIASDEESFSCDLPNLYAADLDPFFWRPERLGTASAWWGHVPFGNWLIKVTRPRLLVELGTHTGVSYSCFCETVVREQLSSRCFAVDTWQGDEQAGYYDDSVYSDFLTFHDKRYAAFSHLLRCRFDEALSKFADASIDILHIDGLHTYEAVKHDFEAWQPKLSRRAVVLFHDTNERAGEFGVWRLWAELLEQFPGFEFTHGHGLGVLAVGQEPPEPIVKLCTLQNTPKGGLIRNRLAFLGERWSSEMREQFFRDEVVARNERIQSIDQDKNETESRLRAELETARAQAASTLAQCEARLTLLAEEQRANEAAAKAHALAEAEKLNREVAVVRQQFADVQRRLEHQATSTALMAQARAQAEAAGFKAKETEARYHRANLELNWIQTELAKARAETDRIISSPVWKATRPLRRLIESAKRRKNSEAADLIQNAELIAKSTLFDSAWYCETYPDVVAAGVEPIAHYLKDGAPEGRNPGPQFDGNWYLQQYPDVAAAGENPLLHYLRCGQQEGREIQSVASAVALDQQTQIAADSGLFDVDWYLEQNPDVLAVKENPLVHYLRCGAREGRNPGPEFDGNWYLERYPDVAAAGENPLIHYLLHGQAEGRESRPVQELRGQDLELTPQKELAVDEVIKSHFQALAPLRTFSIPKAPPRLTLLVDRMDSRSLSGPGATALILSAFVAGRTGASLRVVTRSEEPDISEVGTILSTNGIFWSGNLECIYSPSTGGREIAISENDSFLTTSWWTTRSVRGVVDPRRIIYLVQEDERILYPFGDERLRCEETLADPDIRFLVNSEILFEHLTTGPDTLHNIRDRGITFEPTFPAANYAQTLDISSPSTKKNFLFLACPDDPTNLYFRGLEVVTAAIENGLLRREDWNFHVVGKSLKGIALPGDIRPSILESRSENGYAALAGKVDLGLGLMDTPHPSYALLELAANGSVVVTNRRGVRTSLTRYSRNILCAESSVEGLLTGLEKGTKLAANAATRLENYKRSKIQREWAVTLEPILQAFARSDAARRA